MLTLHHNHKHNMYTMIHMLIMPHTLNMLIFHMLIMYIHIMYFFMERRTHVPIVTEKVTWSSFVMIV